MLVSVALHDFWLSGFPCSELGTWMMHAQTLRKLTGITVSCDLLSSYGNSGKPNHQFFFINSEWLPFQDLHNAQRRQSPASWSLRAIISIHAKAKCVITFMEKYLGFSPLQKRKWDLQPAEEFANGNRWSRHPKRTFVQVGVPQTFRRRVTPSPLNESANWEWFIRAKEWELARIVSN